MSACLWLLCCHYCSYLPSAATDARLQWFLLLRAALADMVTQGGNTLCCKARWLPFKQLPLKLSAHLELVVANFKIPSKPHVCKPFLAAVFSKSEVIRTPTDDFGDRHTNLFNTTLFAQAYCGSRHTPPDMRQPAARQTKACSSNIADAQSETSYWTRTNNHLLRRQSP